MWGAKLWDHGVKFKEVHVLPHGGHWREYENAIIYISKSEDLILIKSGDNQILLPMKTIKVITMKDKEW